jgi:glutamyl-tRNA reductase
MTSGPVPKSQLHLLALSFGYKQTADDVRTCLAFTVEQKRLFEQRVIANDFGPECFVLSTCNRTEIYVIGKDVAGRDAAGKDVTVRDVNTRDRLARLQQLLADASGLDLAQVEKTCNFYVDSLAVRHLMRVACGLDSMLVGEDQILGQVREACQLSSQAGTIGRHLKSLLQAVQHCARQVRTQSGLAGNPWSIPTLALQLAVRQLTAGPDPSDPPSTVPSTVPSTDLMTVLLLGGSGRTGQILLRDLLDRYQGRIKILATCRQPDERLLALRQDQPELQIIDYADRYQWLDAADLIISATRSPHLTLTADRCRPVLQQGKPRVFVDLAMPMDIDEQVASLPGAQLIRLDQVQALAAENNQARLAAAEYADCLVEQQADEFEKKLFFRQNLPLIQQLMTRAENLAESDQPGTRSPASIRRLIYQVRDHVNCEDFTTFIQCLQKGLGAEPGVTDNQQPGERGPV